MIKGIIFDLDGVLTDTAEYHYQGWKKLAEELNIKFTRQDNEKLRGVSRQDSLKIILNGQTIDHQRMEELMDKKNEYYISLINHMTPDDLFNNVEDILTTLIEKNIKIAVGSASKNAKTVLNKLDITKYIDFIGDGYTVDNAKPAPDLFIHCAQALGLKEKECIVVEDAEAGIQAAKSAGMKTLGIGQATKEATININSLEDTNVQDFMEIISKISQAPNETQR